MLTLKAHAKINLTLEVLGRRDDGYHEVATIMQTVDLHDTVRLSPAADITLTCDDPSLQSPTIWRTRRPNSCKTKAAIQAAPTSP